MKNYKMKFVKSAAALALGASVITSAVVAGDLSASAKTTYKVSNGKLVNAKTKKAIKGYKVYKSVLYKDGKKFTGTYKAKYYKAGTLFTGLVSKTYYKKGVKATATYKGVYYKAGKAFTGKTTVKGVDVLYKNGKVVADKTAPVITIDGQKAGDKIELKNGADFTTPKASVKDNVDSKVKVVTEIKDQDGKVVDAIDTKVAGTYTITYAAKDASNNTSAATVTVVVGEADLAVESVKAMNATQVQIELNKAADAKSIFANGKDGSLKDGVVVSVTPVGSTAVAHTTELSKDGKTLTLTFANAITGSHVVKVSGIKASTGESVKEFEQVIKFEEDKTAPTIATTEKVNASQTKVTFSEPLASEGSVSYKYADGTTATGVAGQLSTDGKTFNITLGDVEAGKEITVTFIGATDKAGNLMEPNPSTTKVTKGAKDGVKPTIVSLAQSGVKTVTVKFSEDLVTVPKQITVNDAQSIDQAPVQDEKDSTKYTYSFAAPFATGSYFVKVEGFTDLSGEIGDTYNKVNSFVKDEVAPKISSSQVVTVDGKQYLDVTFDKDVVLAADAKVAATGSYVSNYATTDLTSIETSAAYKVENDNTDKKVVRVALANLLGDKDVKDAKYNLNLTLSGISSEAAVSLADGTTSKVSFTRAADAVAANTTEQSLESIVQDTADNNKVVVTFKENVDPQSATNAANYLVSGATVESVKYVTDTPKKVVLTLAKGSNTFTGERNVTVNNVKAAGSTVTMKSTSQKVSLTENVAPTFTASLVDGTHIKVTFSEPVAAKTADAAIATTNFGLAQKDVVDSKAAITGIASDNQGTAMVSGKSYKEVYLTVSGLELSKSIQLSAKDLVDALEAGTTVGNAVSADAVTVSGN